MKKTSMIALLAMFLTASLTFAAGSIQAIAQDDPPVLDCWREIGDVNDKNDPPPDMSTSHDCQGIEGTCCYNESGSFSELAK